MLVTSQDLRVEKTFKTMIKDKKKKVLYQKILIKMQYKFKSTRTVYICQVLPDKNMQTLHIHFNSNYHYLYIHLVRKLLCYLIRAQSYTYLTAIIG